MPRPLAIAALVFAFSPSAIAPAFAEDAHAADEHPVELGLYLGGFISNYYHQFYDISIPNRPLLDTVNPEMGIRGAYFPLPWIGAEGEASWIMAHTSPAGQAASIFGLRAQVVVQYLFPEGSQLAHTLIPFVGAGIGLDHVSSDMSVLGSDTDFPIHIGGGARVFVTPTIALRADLRFLRGPSQQAPYTLNASYGEFMFGVSFVPDLSSHPSPVVTERDSDGDGIPDSVDQCPNEPEDKDLFDDTDGCPDPDNDHDGIPDVVDKCPLDAEDKDGFMDDDGCPEPDNDADGIPDAQDKCPNEPEDKDGFEDLDGCPDLDNDHDGIPDRQDKCPNEPETINGVDDDDGCPDKGMALVVLSPDRLELLEPVQFTGFKIAKSSTSLLGQIGATLRAHDEIVRLRITVHVQPTSDPDKDQDISDKRAVAIRDWLVQYGIAAIRIEPRGFGGTKPLVPADSKGAASINERIDLIILERK